MLKTTATQIAGRVKQSLRAENNTLPQSVQVIKTRRQRKRHYTR